MSNVEEKSGAGSGGHRVDLRCRRWSEAEKRQIVAESHEPGDSVSIVARRYNVNANQMFKSRRLYRDLARDVGPGRFVPAVVEATPDGEVDGLAMCTSSGDSVSKGPAAADRIEFVLADGGRVIVDREVDGRALAQVLAVLARR